MRKIKLTFFLIVSFLLMSCNKHPELWGEVYLNSQLGIYVEHLENQIDIKIDSLTNLEPITLIDEVYYFIDTIKLRLIQCEYPKLHYIDRGNEKMITSTYPVELLLLGEDNNGLAYELNIRIKKLKVRLLDIFSDNPYLFKNTQFYLNTMDPPRPIDENDSWEENTFELMTLLSADNYLTYFQLYLLNLKKEILNESLNNS